MLKDGIVSGDISFASGLCLRYRPVFTKDALTLARFHYYLKIWAFLIVLCFSVVWEWGKATFKRVLAFCSANELSTQNFQRMFRARLLVWVLTVMPQKCWMEWENASSTFCGLGVDTILTWSKIYGNNNLYSTDWLSYLDYFIYKTFSSRYERFQQRHVLTYKLISHDPDTYLGSCLHEWHNRYMTQTERLVGGCWIITIHVESLACSRLIS